MQIEVGYITMGYNEIDTCYVYLSQPLIDYHQQKRER